MKKIILTIGMMILITDRVWSAFENISWGARPMGMGGAFTAIASDANTLFWNPAGMTQIEGEETSFMFARPYEGLSDVNLKMNCFTYVHSLNDSAIGIGWTNFSSLRYREDAWIFSYAYSYRCKTVEEERSQFDMDAHLRSIGISHETTKRKGLLKSTEPTLPSKFSIGLNFKCLNHGYELDEDIKNDPIFIDSSSKAVFGLDVGILYLPNAITSFGFSAQNIFNSDIGLKEEDTIPQELRVGAAFKTPNAIPALDVSLRDDVINIHFGAEIPIIPEVLVGRCGLNLNGSSVGIGYTRYLHKASWFTIDYACVIPFYFEEITTTHSISTMIRF